jgi:DNA helicase TIP49 (TBP-interacting protein)
MTQTLNKTIEPTLSLCTKLKNKLRGRIKALHNLKIKLKEEPNFKATISLKRFAEITPEIRKRIEENTDSLVDQGSAGLLSFWEFRKENSEAFMSSISRLFFIR